MNRRHLLLGVLTGLWLLGGCGQPEPQRPNIIVVITDDHRYDFLGSVRPDVLQTPNLDRLAQEGVRFENAFVTTSLCSPARASYLTGLHTHTHGVIMNEEMDISPETPNIGQRLQELGYETAFIGKWHMARRASPRPGFDHWVSFHGQGHYFTNTLNVDGQWELCRNYITDELTDRALAFMDRPHDRPWLMFVSHKAVHEPFDPADRDTNLYRGVPVPGFDRQQGDVRDKAPWRENRRAGSGDLLVQRYRQTLAAVDEGVGSLLDHLAEKGQLENTAIIYVGDNGYLMGEHGGLWDKRAPFEPSIRVPMILRYPAGGRQGQVDERMVLNLDLVPTLLQLAGAPADTTLPGRSMLDEGEGRDSFLYEYFAYEGKVPTCMAVRTDRWKLVIFPLNPDLKPELYDLQEDPDETTNRVEDPALRPLAQELQAKLEEHLVRTGFQWPQAGPPSKDN